MAIGQGSRGKIELFSDFAGVEQTSVTLATAGPINFFPFVLVGDGLAETDSGAISQTTLLGGVIRLTCTDESNHCLYVATEKSFDVALMSPLIAEARVQKSTLTGGRIFLGFTNDSCDADVATVCEANTGTVTNTMTNFAGIYWDSGATLSSTWLYSHRGGTAAQVTTEQSLGKTFKAGEWDVIRVEIFNDGMARFAINGEYITSVVGAISTTTDIGMLCGIGNNTTSGPVAMDLDYVYVSASRDWTK